MQLKRLNVYQDINFKNLKFKKSHNSYAQLDAIILFVNYAYSVIKSKKMILWMLSQ